MNFEFPQYEFKGDGRIEWEEITEKCVLENLGDTFQKIVPAITDLLNGLEVTVGNGVCRLKKPMRSEDPVETKFRS